MKQRLKSISFFRENYRRLRKIFLHIIHGRFYLAIKLANHYNPVYRLTVRNPIYLKRRQRKSLARELAGVYSYPAEGQKGLKVQLIIRNGDFLPSSSAFIRLIGPLTDNSLKDKVTLRIDSPRTASYENADLLIVQRAAFDNIKQARSLVDSAKSKGAKIIIDIDDSFNAIDEKHPEYYEYTKRLEAVEYLLNYSDQIWVSTRPLVYKSLSAKTKVVPNSLDPRLWQAGKTRIRQKGPIQMVYMGTVTHDSDLAMIIPALDKLNEEYPGSFTLTIIGVSQDLPERDWATRLTTPYLGSLYPTFVKWFLKRGPYDIGLSPLVDTEFNRAKSDIKCLDYLGAGIMPVVSDLLPYQSDEIKDFIVKVKNTEASWFKVLSDIVSDPAGFRAEKAKTISKAQNYIWRKRSAKNTAKTLINNLSELAK